MVPSRSGAQSFGRYEWNSYENYRALHERYLDAHSIIEEHSVTFEVFDLDGETLVEVAGSIRCRNGVILEVQKYAQTELRGSKNPRLWVRTYSFRYNAYLPGNCTVLRYDNGHGSDFEQYHAHPFDLKTGEAAKNGRRIARDEMPHLSDVLDEIQSLPL